MISIEIRVAVIVLQIVVVIGSASIRSTDRHPVRSADAFVRR